MHNITMERSFEPKLSQLVAIKSLELHAFGIRPLYCSNPL